MSDGLSLLFLSEEREIEFIYLCENIHVYIFVFAKWINLGDVMLLTKTELIQRT